MRCNSGYKTGVRLVSLTLIALLSGCGGGGGGDSSAPQGPTADSANLSVAKAVYGINAQVPAGFYTESNPYPDRQTLTLHVRQGDVAPVTGGTNFEVCSDDFSEALDWSAANASRLGYTTNLTGNSEDDWYFQFDREIVSTEPAMLVNRVFKCATVDRSMVSSDLAGTLNRRPLDAASLKFLAEYLWGFSDYNNALNAVIESRGTAATSSLYEHRITRAVALRYAGSNQCDLIEVWQQYHRVDRTSGVVSVDEVFDRVFEAKLQAGVASLCSN